MKKNNHEIDEDKREILEKIISLLKINELEDCEA